MSHAAEPISVLMVEDEFLISALVSDVLSEHGFAVHAAADGQEALSYIDSGAAIDVLFTDINLPGAIDGAELAKRVRDRWPEMPIVYASGRYSASGINNLVSRSVFVPKPYNPEDVCTLLGRLTEAA